MRPGRLTLPVFALSIGFCSTVFPQDRTPPASGPAPAAIPLADQAADDALARLVDMVMAARCEGGRGLQSVASLLASLPPAQREAAERELRTGIYAEARLGRPRRESDTTAVDASLSASSAGALLSTLLAKGGDGPGSQVRLPDNAGPALVATGMAHDDAPRDPRPGWRHCGPADIRAAEEAARYDLRNRVVALLNRIPVSERQSVGHLARQEPRLTDALHQQVRPVTGAEPAFGPQGLCVVTATISPGQIETLILTALRSAGLETGQVRLGVPRQAVEVEGTSVAPPAPSRPRTLARGPRPEWVEKTLSKTATAAGPANEPDVAFRDTLAIKAATVEARRQLWLELEAIVLPDGRTVAQAIESRPDRREVIQSIDAAVFEVSKPSVTEQGVAKASLGVRLEAVWQLLAR